jgi:hypothetical protein
MFAEDAFLFCASTKDGVAGFFVERIGFEFHTDTVPDFKRIGSENDGFAPILFGGGFFYETLKVFESTHRVRNLTENIVQRILGDLPEKGTCSGRSGSSVMAEPSNLTGAAIGGVDGTEVIGISLWRGARCYEFTALRVRGKWPNWQR